MKLAIDVGNTLIKLALFDGNEILLLEKQEQLEAGIIENILSRFPGITSAIIGSVRDLPAAIQTWFPGHLKLYMLSSGTPLPIKLDYNTPATLGADRIAAVVTANHLYPETNLLVIESGTCVTYDFIDAGGVYRGGSISPGIELRFRALHNFTDKLPLIQAAGDIALIGKSTETSIRSGVINGLLAEMQGIISMYEHNYDNLTVILSGGNLEYFDKILKNNIFAVPNIVLSGLNIILEFNDKN